MPLLCVPKVRRLGNQRVVPWFRAFVGYSLSTCHRLRPREFLGCLYPVPSPWTLAFDPSRGSRHFHYPHTPILVRETISGLHYRSLSLRPVDLLAHLSELTRSSPSRRGLLLLQGQLGKFPWQDFRLLERQLASLQLDDDLKTTLPRHIVLKDEKSVVEMAQRGGLTAVGKVQIGEAIRKKEGGVWLELTEEQYAKLLRSP